MNVLLFLEPVIYRQDPDALQAHFPWVEAFRRISQSIGGRFALAANRETCRAWQTVEQPGLDVEIFELNAFSMLAGFRDKVGYSQALYETAPPPCALTNALRTIRARFQPDLILTTAQNAYAVDAFVGIGMLHVEQPALPRMGHPFRSGFDPCGHQVGAFLDVHHDAIRNLALPVHAARGAADLLEHVEQTRRTINPLAGLACEALAEIAGGERIALLATQPTDAVTFEGAYRQAEMHDLLFDWAERLPPGWIGVPTYHAGQTLSEELEAALACSSQRIRLLPRNLSCGLSEALITQADGLVTISSTSAMAALLFGKKAVVVGRSPFTRWCASRPEAIEQAPTLSRVESSRCMAVLTHRFSVLHEAIMADPVEMKPHFERARDGTAANWYLDLADWSLPRAQALFGDVSHSIALPPAGFMLRASVPVHEYDALSVQWQHAIKQRDDLDRQQAQAVEFQKVLSNELDHAIADRNRIDAERLNAESTAEVLRAELDHAIADRNRIDAERLNAESAAEVLRAELDHAIADRDRIDAERLDAESTAEVLRAELDHAIADRNRIDAERLDAESKAAVLHAELDHAIADRDRIDAERLNAESTAAVLRAELDHAIADRDRIDAERLDAESTAEVLRAELDHAIADRNRIDAERLNAESAAEVLRAELDHAIADRDRIDAERLDAESTAAVLHAELDHAIADRDRIDAERLDTESTAAVLHAELDHAIADRNRIDAERLNAESAAEVLRAELDHAIADRDRIDAERLDAESTAEVLRAELDHAIADRNRIDAERLNAESAAEVLRAELDHAIADRDRIDAERLDAESTAAVLRAELDHAIADRDRIDAERLDTESTAAVLRAELDHAIADRNRIDAERLNAESAAEVLRAELDHAIADRDRIDAERLDAESTAEVLRAELDHAIADRNRIDAECADAQLHRDLLAAELSRAIKDRDHRDRALAQSLALEEMSARDLAAMTADRDEAHMQADALRAALDVLAAQLKGVEDERFGLQSHLKSVGEFWKSTRPRRFAARVLGYDELENAKVSHLET